MHWTGFESLGDKHLVSVVLRIVLDQAGALIYLEMVEVNNSAGLRLTRWDELEPSLRTLVESVMRTERQPGTLGSDEQGYAS